MNKIDAKVEAIESLENITVVSFSSFGQPLKMMSLEMNKEIKIGSKVTLGVKASSISIAKNLSTELSISNQLLTTVISVNNGTLLASIKLRFEDFILESIITLESSKRLKLHEGDTVIALIKSSDLSVLEYVQ
ncbi:MAG: TOBE domain-containing protein [Sulfurimonas sp.]